MISAIIILAILAFVYLRLKRTNGEWPNVERYVPDGKGWNGRDIQE